MKVKEAMERIQIDLWETQLAWLEAEMKMIEEEQEANRVKENKDA